MTFHFSGKATVSIYTVVEADSYKEAIAIANHRDLVNAAYGASSSDSWLMDDPDGTPFDIRED
jgi:hypothetical protein